MMSSFVDLFTAALASRADVTLHEKRTPGAKGALIAWASALNIEVKERIFGRIGGGRHVSYYVETLDGELQVIVRDAATVEARS